MPPLFITYLFGAFFLLGMLAETLTRAALNQIRLVSPGATIAGCVLMAIAWPVALPWSIYQLYLSGFTIARGHFFEVGESLPKDERELEAFCDLFPDESDGPTTPLEEIGHVLDDHCSSTDEARALIAGLLLGLCEGDEQKAAAELRQASSAVKEYAHN